MFEELEKELSEIKTRKFHIAEKRNAGDVLVAKGNQHLILPKSYQEFVSKFGGVKLYRVRDYYQVGVLSAPEEKELKDGQHVLCIGHFQSHLACFKSSLIFPDKDSPVFEEINNRFTKIADTFEEWLIKRTAKARASYKKKEWQQILKGPKPFTPQEEAICLARKKYKWRLNGFDETGDAEIVVKNESELVLPFLTIGVMAKDKSFGGGIWVNVSGIQPGEEKIVTHQCYKNQIAREKIELYEMSDPIPEERDLYWEFR